MKKTVAIAILIFVNSAGAAFQLELKGYDVFGETETGNGNFGSNAAAIVGNVYGTFKLAPEFHLFFNEDLDNVMRLAYTEPGVTPVEKMSPFSEKKIPSSNNLEAGAWYTGVVVASLRLKNMMYLDALPVYPNYLQTNYIPVDPVNYIHSEDAVKRFSRNVLEGSLQKTFGGLSLSADANYFSMHYSVEQHGFDMTNYSDTVFNSFDDTYNDLWPRFNMEYAISDNMQIKGEVFGKFNLNRNSLYDWGRYSLQIAGNREFPSDNKFQWGVTGRWFQNKILQDKGFALGPQGLAYLRDVFEFGDSWYLKCLYSMEVGHNMYKHRIEGGVRKAWENESYQEVGYYANQGGLFPMQGFYVKTKEYLFKPFSVAVNIKSVWEGPDNPNYNKIRSENMASYIKTAGNLELAYTLFTHCELLSGVDYTYFNAEVLNDSDFPTRGAGYLGVRMWFE